MKTRKADLPEEIERAQTTSKPRRTYPFWTAALTLMALAAASAAALA